MSSHRESKKKWYRETSAKLRCALGGRCRKCKVKRKRPLHFDVKTPVDGGRHHRKQGPCQRLRFYLAQHAAGNLDLLCNSCNSVKGATKDKAYYARIAYEQDIESEGQVLAALVIEEVPF